jgi:K+-transporting ATPase ATPase A chain
MIGIAALVAIIRGLRGDKHMGNFYVDLWRGTAYVFVPLCLIVGVLLMASGVPMTLDGHAEVTTLEPGAMGADSNGQPTLVQQIARGPVAAIVAAKQFGTNGGGFFGVNSAHPFENPNAFSNLLTCLGLFLLPVSALVMFGKMLNRYRDAAVIFGVMLVLSLGTVAWAISHDTLKPNPALTAHAAQTYSTPDATTANGQRDMAISAVAGLPVDQSLGNLEGKELRFGTAAGATWSALTTNTSNGSVNAMHDSLNPLAGLVPLTGMWLNCIWGGVGVGLINFLIYLVIGVFLAGLMVGRTPEYLGKKVEGREMKLAMLALLIHPLMILGPVGLFAATDWGIKAESNPGAHGFSQVLYEFTSASANNGSGFEGLGDTWGFNKADDNPSSPAPYSRPWDIATGLVMLLSRFIPIIAPIALAASLAKKKPTPFTVGTMRTDTFTFACVLLGTIILVGALLFLPVAALGPVAEHFGPIPFGG